MTDLVVLAWSCSLSNLNEIVWASIQNVKYSADAFRFNIKLSNAAQSSLVNGIAVCLTFGVPQSLCRKAASSKEATNKNSQDSAYSTEPAMDRDVKDVGVETSCKAGENDSRQKVKILSDQPSSSSKPLDLCEDSDSMCRRYKAISQTKPAVCRAKLPDVQHKKPERPFSATQTTEQIAQTCNAQHSGSQNCSSTDIVSSNYASERLMLQRSCPVSHTNRWEYDTLQSKVAKQIRMKAQSSSGSREANVSSTEFCICPLTRQPIKDPVAAEVSTSVTLVYDVSKKALPPCPCPCIPFSRLTLRQRCSSFDLCCMYSI